MSWVEGEVDVRLKQIDCSKEAVVLGLTFGRSLVWIDTCLLLSRARSHTNPSEFLILVTLSEMVSSRSLQVSFPSTGRSLYWSVDISWGYIGPTAGRRGLTAGHEEGEWELGCISGSY